MITNLADQLLRDEGLRLHPYRDSVGKLTIGIGRNLDGVEITLAEADTLLANDIKAATVALEANFSWAMELDEVRKGAMLNLTFNMGVRNREHGKLAEVPAVGGWSEFRQDLWLTKV